MDISGFLRRFASSNFCWMTRKHGAETEAISIVNRAMLNKVFQVYRKTTPVMSNHI